MAKRRNHSAIILTGTLFSVGFILSLLIDNLMQSKGLTDTLHTQAQEDKADPRIYSHHRHHAHMHFTSDIFNVLLISPWLPVSFGLAGSLIGNVFPLVDRYLGFKPKKKSRELSAVVRLLGGVMGVNYAISRLQWMDHSQATGAITLLSLGLWFIFDRTLHGFGVSVLFALVGTAFGVVLVSHGLYTFASPDFLGIRAWFPCVLFLSAVCFGAIGRLMTDYSVHKDGKSQKKA